MKTYNEWNRLKLTFAEKVTLFQNRLYALQSAYTTMGYAQTGTMISYGVGAVGCSTPAAPDAIELMTELDEIWNEMKSDIKEAKKVKPAKKTK